MYATDLGLSKGRMFLHRKSKASIASFNLIKDQNENKLNKQDKEIPLQTNYEVYIGIYIVIHSTNLGFF